MDNQNKDKTWFIITPIGDDQSDIRRAAEGVIDAVIVPALVNMGFEEKNINVAHRMPSPGSINRQVITSVLECDLAIANLTNLNPNVMYELAIRHAARKPVIQICQKGTRLPFDITEERTIFYTNDMAGVIELSENFKGMIMEAMGEEEPDNPIYRVVESNTIMKNVDASDPSRYILDRMSSLENNFTDLINSLNSNNKRQSNVEKDYFNNRNKVRIPFEMEDRVDGRESIRELLDNEKKTNSGIAMSATFIGDSGEIEIKTKDFEYVGEVVGKLYNLVGISKPEPILHRS